jgi:hypothetical protein
LGYAALSKNARFRAIAYKLSRPGDTPATDAGTIPADPKWRVAIFTLPRSTDWTFDYNLALTFALRASKP